MSEKLTLNVELGYLTEVPANCWESHSRGKNWLAIIRKSPTSPGGLGRDFQDKGRGDYYYSVSGLKRGHAVEFGADYYSGRGRKSPSRKYGVVLSVSDTALELETFPTALEAITAAKGLPAEAPEVEVFDPCL